ncbi:MAG: hypothetical protein ACJ73N_10555 [Bryobacteraceae bacterium]
MPVLSRFLWAIKIKGARTIHLAETDEQGAGPLAVPLCGKSCGAADRGKTEKTKQVRASTCVACLRKAGYADPEKKRGEDILSIAKALKNFNLPLEVFREVLQAVLTIRDEQIRLRDSQEGA